MAEGRPDPLMVRTVAEENRPMRYKSREVARLLGIYVTQIPDLIHKGDIRAEKVGRQFFIDGAEVERLLLERKGVRSLEAANEKITALEARIEVLQQRLLARDGELDRRLSEAGQREVDSAEEALRLVGARRALELLNASGLTGSEVWAKRRQLQQAIDTEDRPTFAGKRPRNASKVSVASRLSTGIGPIDVWYWRAKSGIWWAVFGGPRPSRRLSDRRKSSLMKLVSVLARSEYGKPVRLMSQRQRFFVLRRDGFACHYCGRKPPEVELHVDHIKSIADGGSNELDNLTTACADCNMGKSDR